MFGKFEGENVEHLHKLATLTLSCVLSELKNVDNKMRKFPQFETTVQLPAAKRFRQDFSQDHHTQAETKLIDDCCRFFSLILETDLHEKLIGFLEMRGYITQSKPAKNLSESFIAAFDALYRDLKEEK